MNKKYFDITKKIMCLDDFKHILSNNKKIKLNHLAVSRIKKSRHFLNQQMTNEELLIYGVNTGFGSLCNTKINKSQINTLQKNLILSHACGVGDVVPDHLVKIILLLKIRSLSFGYSGVRLTLIKELVSFYNQSVLPIIFTQGSLGASGDLAPLAHLSLPLIGRGEVKFQGRKVATKTFYNRINKKPITLSFKEGLALLNGTQFMSAYGVWCIIEAQKIYHLANLIASVSLEAFSCSPHPFSPLVSSIRPHNGHVYTSKEILNILQGSRGFGSSNDYVQDPYSFRCIPQVHGACLDVINHVKSIFNTEINSVTDNPNVFYKNKSIISAGNFHGQSLAMAMDYLSIGVSEIGSISERRTFQLISGSRNLPVYLIKNPGLNSGFMISQYTAASIASQNKQYATPSSIDSIVSSNGQEDHVSMGANAATKLYKIVSNVNTILSIELLNAAQAFEFKKIKTSSTLRRFLTLYRKEVPFIDSDQQLNIYINKTQSFIDNFDIFKLLKLSS